MASASRSAPAVGLSLHAQPTETKARREAIKDRQCSGERVRIIA